MTSPGSKKVFIDEVAFVDLLLRYNILRQWQLTMAQWQFINTYHIDKGDHLK